MYLRLLAYIVLPVVELTSEHLGQSTLPHFSQHLSFVDLLFPTDSSSSPARTKDREKMATMRVLVAAAVAGVAASAEVSSPSSVH